MNLPKYVGREFKKFDWYGWIMALLGCVVMYFLIKDVTMAWPMKIIYFGMTLLIFLDYVWRVAYGRVYKLVYYDTLLYNMYEVGVGSDTYFVCASDEEELSLYMNVNYPTLEYRVIHEHPLESFIKTEKYE